MKTIFIFLISTQLHIGCLSVTCVATTNNNGVPTPGSTCTGANFCTGVWNYTGGQWMPISQYCTQTSLIYNPYSAWIITGRNTATLTCTLNMCNAVKPPAVIPTPTPVPVPSSIQCVRKNFPSNNGTTCVGTGCLTIFAGGSLLVQDCAPGMMSSTRENTKLNNTQV